MALALALATAAAAQKVGYLFGWLIGASLSPLGATVAPLLFGLLAVLGLGGAMWRTPEGHALRRLRSFRALPPDQQREMQAELERSGGYGRLVLVAGGLWIFCVSCQIG
ncbi:MAG TPA: hypothetical protein VFV87_04065, partial [Pirellulaceae bacterium]|nr:hypothetical protein [Pirellulaceae bacterium]